FVVNVRTGGSAAASEKRDHVAAVNMLPGVDENLAGVAIPGLESVAVVENDGLPVAGFGPSENAGPVRGSMNRCAGAIRDVEAFVHLYGAADRSFTNPEARCEVADRGL